MQAFLLEVFPLRGIIEVFVQSVAALKMYMEKHQGTACLLYPLNVYLLS